MTAINTYLRKLDDMMSRPDLQTTDAREQLLHRLLAYWTGQLRRGQRSGDAHLSGFSPLEISDLITILENRIKALRADNPTGSEP